MSSTFMCREGWVVGESGTVLRTDQYGDFWTNQTSCPGTTNYDFYAIASHASGSREAWMVGDYGSVCYTLNDGKSWSRQVIPSGM